MRRPEARLLPKQERTHTLLSHPLDTPMHMLTTLALGAALTFGSTPALSQRPTLDIVDTAVAAGDFEVLATALTQAGLVDTLKGKGPFTVFAPTDAAFRKLPDGTLPTLLMDENVDQLAGILTYHVVSGKVLAKDVVNLTSAVTVNGQQVDIRVEDGKVFVDGAQVVTTDILASNGVIHVIDSVLLPSSNDIVATARAAGTFGTLMAAAQAAGLVEALQGPGPLTVLAPTDEAFAALPAGTVERLLQPENKDQLAAILTYHVIPGRIFAAQALADGSFETLQGDNVEFALRGGKAVVSGAPILATDIDASNGVIHVLGKVLMPPAKTAAAPASSSCCDTSMSAGS